MPKRSGSDGSWDEMITQNAVLFLKRRVAGRRMEHRAYFLNTLAEEMCPFMGHDPSLGRPDIVEIDRISRTVARYLGLSRRNTKIAWRLDYLEAFCRALGISLLELFRGPIEISEEERLDLERLSAHASWITQRPKGTRSRRQA